MVGNPKPNSRTARIATRLVETLLPAGSHDLTVIDLAEHAGRIFDWPSEQMAALNAEVAASDLLVLASPTYKASYTGLLKAFLDRYPHLGLDGVVAIPVMTGSDLRHAMAPEVAMRPVLVELGAVVPTQGLFFVINQMGQLDQVLAGWARDNVARLTRHLPGVVTACRESL
ncbi:MAG TPA: NAD(P)H-dependent oxidoreductase [Amycolatopsis sp.]|nr:NAD(P)H-dependent oxidoreductase [Amycolatopsis sp.]